MTVPGLEAPIENRDIDAVLAFLPRLQALSPNEAAHWPQIEQISEKKFLIDPGEDHPLVTEFIRALYEHGLVRDFDWPKWQSVAERYFNQPEELKRVRMKTCVKLLTLHARQDHFSYRHFACMVQLGHIQAILCRMAEIRRKQTGLLPTDSDQS